MRSVFMNFRRFWSKYEFIKSTVLVATGAIITAYFYHSSKSSLFCHPTYAAEFHLAHRGSLYDSLLTAQPIQKLGVPHSNNPKIFDEYICAYDRRNRIPYWVMEHLTRSKISRSQTDQNNLKEVDRKQFDFCEDSFEIPMFRATNQDYFRSGYDRGHMAAAGNNRYNYEAMKQTFILSNVAPQVGEGFNRGAWNDLEKYIRAIVRRSENVVVITGPLFLPHKVGNKKFVSYEVIGENNIAVPTHFFKAIAIQETPQSEWRTVAWVMPNQKLPENINLKQFLVPLDSVERASGFKLFPNLS